MKTLLAAAALAVGLTMLNPIQSIAGVTNGNGEYCPPNNNHEVPEPATLAMVGAALGWIALKKKKA